MAIQRKLLWASEKLCWYCGVVGWLWAGQIAGVEKDLPRDGVVFAAVVEAPNLGASSVVPRPRVLLDPLEAARVPHWRFRYERGRLVELSRRDAQGSLEPMRPPHGEVPEHGYLLLYANGEQRPRAIVTPSDVRYELEYTADGRVRQIQCTTKRSLRGLPWSRMRIGYRNGRLAWVSYWNGDEPSYDLSLIHRKEFGHDARGFVSEVRYYDRYGRPWGGLMGISRMTFERGPEGEWLSVTYWGDDQTRTNDWFGVSQYRFTYASDGRVLESITMGVDDAPVSNAFGAYRMEWQYDGEGNLIGTRGYAVGGKVVYDGRAVMPDLYERTLIDAVLQRVRLEFGAPYWQLADYAELQRASRRWHARYASAWRAEVPFVAEQGRVLLDYLLQVRAGAPALQGALLAYGLGMRDPRLLQYAILGTGVLPHPESRAARTLLGIVLGGMPSNSVLICGTDTLFLLSMYATCVRGVRTDVMPVAQNLLADSTMNESMRARLGTRLWLPGLNEIQTAVRQYIEQTGTGDVPRRVRALPLQIRGREAVARINVALTEEVAERNCGFPVAIEEGFDNTVLYEALVPRGPLFWYGTNMSECATAQGLVAWWREVAAGSDGWPRNDDWEAVRALLARSCAAQGHYWWWRGEEHTATQLFRLAMHMHQEERESYVRWIRVLHAARRYEEALSVAEEWERVAGEDEEARQMIEECRAVVVAVQQLAEVEARIRERLGDVTLNLLRRIELQERLGYREAAQKNAAMLVKEAAGRVDVLERLAAFYDCQNDTAGLQRCLELLTEAAPREFRYWVSRAAMAFAAGAVSNGVEYLRVAAEIDKLRLRRFLETDRLLMDLRARGETNAFRTIVKMVEDE